MFGNSNINKSSNSDDDLSKKFFDLSKKATLAESDGNYLSAVNLYLAAYESVKDAGEDMVKVGVEGVKKA